MSLETVLVIVVVVGILGSTIEKIGLATGSERVTNVGKAIEAATTDLPKLINNIFALVSGKKTS